MNEAAARKREPFLTFTCHACNVEVSITNKANQIRTIKGIYCPICRTFSIIVVHAEAILVIKPTQPIVGTITNKRSDAIGLLFAMRYTCNCVAPIPDGEWCGYCKRLLQDED